MTDARVYINEFDPAYERLEALIERVQKEAFEEGFRIAALQMFEIAEEATQRADKIAFAAMG